MIYLLYKDNAFRTNIFTIWNTLLCFSEFSFGFESFFVHKGYVIFCLAWAELRLLVKLHKKQLNFLGIFYNSPPDHLLLDRSPNIGPLISSWELDKFKSCWNRSFRTSKILPLLYQQFSNLLISQRDMNGPRLGALSNNRWSVGNYVKIWQPLFQRHLLASKLGVLPVGVCMLFERRLMAYSYIGTKIASSIEILIVNIF